MWGGGGGGGEGRGGGGLDIFFMLYRYFLVGIILWLILIWNHCKFFTYE